MFIDKYQHYNKIIRKVFGQKLDELARRRIYELMQKVAYIS